MAATSNNAGAALSSASPARKDRQKNCKYTACWQETLGLNNYCALHTKMEQDECGRIFEKIFRQANGEWEHFISKLKKGSDPEDPNLIFVENFEKVLKRFRINLPSDDKEKLVQSFPGRSEDGR